MYNLQNVSFLRMQCAIISGELVCYKHDLRIFHMLNGCNALKLLWYRNLQRGFNEWVQLFCTNHISVWKCLLQHCWCDGLMVSFITYSMNQVKLRWFGKLCMHLKLEQSTYVVGPELS